MSNRLQQTLRSIFIDRNFHRIWQILLKSPLCGPLAFLHGLFSPRILKARRRLIQNLPLNSMQQTLVNNLRQNGFTTLDSLFSAEDFVPLEKYIAQKTRQIHEEKASQISTHKDFWIRLSDSDFKQGMTTDHPLVQLSLKKEVLEVIANYLGQAPFLEYILLTYSVPSPQPLKASQLWHQDHDNDRMVKLFFYLSDVDTELDGPFTLLAKEAESFIKNSFLPRHLPDGEVDSQYPLSKAIQIKGKKFSAFLVDTSVCYHMGSRVSEGHSRLMSTSLYVTLPKAYWGPVKDFIRQKESTSLHSLQKAAIDSSFQTSHD